LALWVDKGKLSYEYNLFEITRTRLDSTKPLPEGKVQIEVETRLGPKPRDPAEVVARINGEEYLRGTVPVTAPMTFTANDSFDVGMDSYSPVSEAYYDRKPFRYNGEIGKVDVTYRLAPVESVPTGPTL
jgi:arylsulfatase